MKELLRPKFSEENLADSQKHTFVASVISIGEQEIANDIYMSIRLRMLTTNPNKNNMAVTEAFIDDVIKNEEALRCLPLFADIKKIENGDLRGLGHMLDNEGRFHSTQIGSFYSFEKLVEADGIALIGTARVPKRNRKVMEAITKLFAEGNLNFSFEIIARETNRRNGIEYIDAAKGNFLIGMAMVSFPAERSAKALALVAEEDSGKIIEESFKYTRYIEIAEANIDTMRMWVWQAVNTWFADDVTEVGIERLCPDCAILYIYETAQTFKMEYTVTDEGLIITDVYEVKLTRKDGVDELEKSIENTVEVTETVEVVEAEQVEIAEDNVPVEQAEVAEQVEEIKQEEKENVEVAEEPEAEKPEETKAEVAEETEETETVAEVASTESEVEIDAMTKRIEELEQKIEEQKAVIASYELSKNAKRAALIAEVAGLDLDSEEVKVAVAEANFIKIASLVEEIKKDEPQKKEPSKENPFVAEIKLEKHDHSYMFESASK
jgi:hypothetical protein